MKLVGDRRGLTLIDLLLATAISVILLGGLVTATLRGFQVTSQSRTQITAVEDIQNAARPIAPDVQMAQQTNLVEDAIPVGQLILDWSSWLDESGQLSQDPVPYHSEYTLLETEGQVQRKYWKDYQAGNPPTTTTTFGRHISNIGFSRHTTASGDYYIRVTIASSPEGRAETAECLTYQISLHRMEDIPIL